MLRGVFVTITRSRVAEIWSYHMVGDEVRFTLVHRNREAAPGNAPRPHAPARPRPAAPQVKKTAARSQEGGAAWFEIPPRSRRRIKAKVAAAAHAVLEILARQARLRAFRARAADEPAREVRVSRLLYARSDRRPT